MNNNTVEIGSVLFSSSSSSSLGSIEEAAHRPRNNTGVVQSCCCYCRVNSTGAALCKQKRTCGSVDVCPQQQLRSLLRNVCNAIGVDAEDRASSARADYNLLSIIDSFFWLSLPSRTGCASEGEADYHHHHRRLRAQMAFLQHFAIMDRIGCVVRVSLPRDAAVPSAAVHGKPKSKSETRAIRLRIDDVFFPVDASTAWRRTLLELVESVAAVMPPNCGTDVDLKALWGTLRALTPAKRTHSLEVLLGTLAYCGDASLRILTSLAALAHIQAACSPPSRYAPRRGVTAVGTDRHHQHVVSAARLMGLREGLLSAALQADVTATRSGADVLSVLMDSAYRSLLATIFTGLDTTSVDCISMPTIHTFTLIQVPQPMDDADDAACVSRWRAIDTHLCDYMNACVQVGVLDGEAAHMSSIRHEAELEGVSLVEDDTTTTPPFCFSTSAHAYYADALARVEALSHLYDGDAVDNIADMDMNTFAVKHIEADSAPTERFQDGKTGSLLVESLQRYRVALAKIQSMSHHTATRPMGVADALGSALRHARDGFPKTIRNMLGDGALSGATHMVLGMSCRCGCARNSPITTGFGAYRYLSLPFSRVARLAMLAAHPLGGSSTSAQLRRLYYEARFGDMCKRAAESLPLLMSRSVIVGTSKVFMCACVWAALCDAAEASRVAAARTLQRAGRGFTARRDMGKRKYVDAPIHDTNNKNGFDYTQRRWTSAAEKQRDDCMHDDARQRHARQRTLSSHVALGSAQLQREWSHTIGLCESELKRALRCYRQHEADRLEAEAVGHAVARATKRSTTADDGAACRTDASVFAANTTTSRSDQLAVKLHQQERHVLSTVLRDDARRRRVEQHVASRLAEERSAQQRDHVSQCVTSHVARQAAAYASHAALRRRQDGLSVALSSPPVPAAARADSRTYYGSGSDGLLHTMHYSSAATNSSSSAMWQVQRDLWSLLE